MGYWVKNGRWTQHERGRVVQKYQRVGQSTKNSNEFRLGNLKCKAVDRIDMTRILMSHGSREKTITVSKQLRVLCFCLQNLIIL